MNRMIGVFVLAFGALWAGPAHATCMIDCTANVLQPGTCLAQGDTPVPAGEVMEVLLTCQTCCSPPGGPMTCNASDPLTEGGLEVTAVDGTPVAGVFEPSGEQCDGVIVYLYTAPDVAGEYQILAGNMIVATFTVGGSQCVTDADCGNCRACVAGMCTVTWVAQCQTDADCGPESYCLTYADKPCANRCADTACFGVKCLAQCEPVTNPCSGGQTCVESIIGCCGQCQQQSECLADQDCGPCQQCMAGLCVDSQSACVSDSDCNEGQWCQAVPGFPCQNACVDNIENPDTDEKDVVEQDDALETPDSSVSEDNTAPSDTAIQSDIPLSQDLAQPEPDTTNSADQQVGSDVTADTGLTEDLGPAPDPGSGNGNTCAMGHTPSHTSGFALMFVALLLLVVRRLHGNRA